MAGVNRDSDAGYIYVLTDEARSISKIGRWEGRSSGKGRADAYNRVHGFKFFVVAECPTLASRCPRGLQPSAPVGGHAPR
jgi:hypothetical protein